ncbi:MAG: hypothetical protein M0Z75_06880, partial [Nitrospiraceae bacterium]|nr:hypothetical protein [Nitrospiraceae bacterium]
QEIKHFLRQPGIKWSRLAGGRMAYGAQFEGEKLTVALTGMGMRNAAACANDLLAAQRPDLVLSVGFAGALYPEAQYGDIVCPEGAWLHPDGEFIDTGGPDFEEFYRLVSEKTVAGRGPIVTLSRWVENEKAALRDFTFTPPGEGSLSGDKKHLLRICDMETFPIARAALKNGSVFFGIRAISDKSGEEINFNPMEIADSRGQISTRLAMLKFAAHPRLIPAAARLQKSSETASLRLALALDALLKSL